MKIRSIVVLGCCFLALVFVVKVVTDLRKTQDQANQLHAILKAGRPGQPISSSMKVLMDADPGAFETRACIRKPQDALECSSVRFRLENSWLHRLRLAPRKTFAGIVVIADGVVIADSVGFGQFPDAAIALTENGKLDYFPRLPDNNYVFKPTLQHFFLTPASSDAERVAALDWDVAFLTSFGTVRNGKELLKSSSR